MNKFLTYITILVFFSSCISGTTDNINTNTYPNADAVYKQITKEYTLNEDGSMLYRESKDIKLLTHYAFNRKYGETFIEYNPDHQKININEAYTTNAEGKKVSTPDNAFNEVLPKKAANSGAYNHLRELVVTHTGLELGATIHLDYELETDADFQPFLMGHEIAAFSSPAQSYTLKIKVPKGQTLNYKLINDTIQPSISNKKDYTTYSWQFTDLPAMLIEKKHQPFKDFKPTVIFSSAESFAQIHEHLTSRPAFSYNLSDKQKAEIKSKINIWSEHYQHLNNMRDFIADEFNYYPVNELINGFKLRTVEEVWNANGGSHLEKTLLLAAAINQVGLIAEPVAVVSAKAFDENCGNLSLFENYLVKIELQNGDKALIDVLNKSNFIKESELENKLLIPLNINNQQIQTIAKAMDNRIAAQIEIRVDRDAESYHNTSVELKDALSPYMPVKCDKDYPRKLQHGESSFIIAEKELTPEKCAFNLQFTKTLKSDKNFLFLPLPVIIDGVLTWHLGTLSNIRTTPFEIPYVINESYTYSVKLDNGLELFSIPENVSISNSVGSYVFKVSQTEDRLEIEKSIVLNKKVISAEEYLEFREIYTACTGKSHSQLIIKR